MLPHSALKPRKADQTRLSALMSSRSVQKPWYQQGETDLNYWYTVIVACSSNKQATTGERLLPEAGFETVCHRLENS